jgi:hypothetical protein
MASDSFGKKYHELEKLPSSEIQSKLGETEGRWQPKSVRKHRRILKAVLKKAESHDKHVRQASKRGEERVANRVKCIQLIDPDEAYGGDIVARFEGTKLCIKKGLMGQSPLIIGREFGGSFFDMAYAYSYEEAVRTGNRVLEGH